MNPLIGIFAHPVAFAVSSSAEGTHGGAEELANLISLLTSYVFTAGPIHHFLHQWENMIWAYIFAGIIILFAQLAAKNPQMIPGRLQNLVEMIVESISDFIMGILGPRGRPFVPFLGSLFVYILLMNIGGILPGGLSPTANPNSTIALALCVFVYSHFVGLRDNGPIGYLKHLAGSPKSGVEWAFVPIMLPVHILGELARPVSLSLRLFGNITGEDVLLYAFSALGVTALSFMHSPIGLPFQVPFILLAFLGSFIQALVFTLLSTIYILLWLPHEEGQH